MNKYLVNLLSKCEPGTVVVSEYVSAKVPVRLSCVNDHVREVIPSNLNSRGNGSYCKQCAGEVSAGKKTPETFLKEVALKYPKLTVIGTYQSAKEYVEVACSEGHRWQVLPTNLLSRESDALCSICNPRGLGSRLALDEVNSRLHVHYPYLAVVDYKGSTQHSEILDARCNKTAMAYTGNLLRGFAYKCIHCEPHLISTSAMGQNLVRFIKSQYSGWVVEQDKAIIAPKHLDVVLPDLGVALEFNGMYYHSDKKCDQYYHLNKTKAVEDFGYSLIHIYGSEWINSRSIVESRLRSLLNTSTKIFARKTTVEPIGFPEDFLNVNHIQGSGAVSSVNYGLFLEGELVAVMTFSKPKYTKNADYDYELVRFCSILDVTVVGGASKLLKRFKQDYPNKTIMSYADRRWSSGGLYKQLGFEFVRNTEPNYVYYKSVTDIVNRYACFKSKLKKRFPEIYSEELTQEQIMTKAGYSKVYDCGNSVWVLK